MILQKNFLFKSLFFLFMIFNYQIKAQVTSENVTKKIFIPKEENPPTDSKNNERNNREKDSEN